MIDMETLAVSWLQLAGTKQHMDFSLNGLRSKSHMSTNIDMTTVLKLMAAHAAGHCNSDKQNHHSNRNACSDCLSCFLSLRAYGLACT